MRPFRIVPYEHWLAYVRPDNLLFGNKAEQVTLDLDYSKLLEAGMDAWMGGTYSLELLKGNLEVTYNGLFGHHSFLTKGFNSVRNPDLYFDEERAVSYEDAYLSFDVLDLWEFLSFFGLVNSRALSFARAYVGPHKQLWGESFRGGLHATFDPETYHYQD